MLIKKGCLWSLSVILCLTACKNDEPEQNKVQTQIKETDRPKASPVRTQSEEGDCANFDFSPYILQNGKLDLSIQMRVLRDKAKVYPSAEAQQPNKTLLAFSTPLRHKEELSDKRIKVATEGHDEPLGWVSLNDLLCTNRPIINPKKGLEKKFYIKTEIQQREQGKPSAFINAYPIPAEQCYDKCRQLSRFTMYFIVDQEKDWYLLADDYHITRPLVGWVRKTDGYLWDTAYGLRPRDDLEYKGNVGAECVYQSLDNAIKKHRCMPVLGGKSWYQDAVRIPLLDIVDRNGHHIPPKNFADKKGDQKTFYKVALAMPGIGVTKDFKITPQTLGEPSIEEGLASMKFIDVFFLIDGTATMQPVIDMIRGKKGAPGIVQNIANTLQKSPDFKDSKIRFGFRVYRDSYAGPNNLGEGLPLRAEHCEELPENYLKKNRQHFQDKIAKVQASVDDKGQDDYPENLFGGLKKVLNRDLRSCERHTKLLFVIGDHGYDKKMLNMKKLQPHLKKLKQGRLVTFFIQMPNKANTAKTPDAYNRAYQLYCTQGDKFLQAVLKGKKNRSKDDYLIRLQDKAGSSSPKGTPCAQWKTIPFNKLENHILKGIRGFSKSSLLSELAVDLRGGAALKTLIEQLRQKHTDVPGLFWEFLEEGNCKTLGKQCDESVSDITFEGYIPVTDNISLDVWMTANQLLDFKQNLLQIFKGLHTQSSSNQRDQIVSAIAESLKIRLMKPEIEPDDTYADYIQRKGGLPVSSNSLLLSYKPEQLENENEVPDCELDRLAVLATNKEEMLSIIYEGKYRPHFKTKQYPKNTCTKASENGKRIPFISGRISKKRLGDDDSYHYDHNRETKTIYWVPQEYLP
ncbi:hypothetical protein PN36_04000 [Candidatus Thiomargarita nelsonii]|uniref:VWFA domain-containing protein n=1 Tax=Candidatus Thiomargarita nelsonii TaxID=1003181 RepID=A0A0A6PM62_9GAMM|nr:hypothetical protein PN36_04000 [Candidatus Thiomargarita nelsonii]